MSWFAGFGDSAAAGWVFTEVLSEKEEVARVVQNALPDPAM